MPFNVPRYRERLTAVVRESFGDLEPQYVDSIKNTHVQLADFVAGAIHAGHSGYSSTFYNLIEPLVRVNQLIAWDILRRGWIEAQK